MAFGVDKVLKNDDFLMMVLKTENLNTKYWKQRLIKNRIGLWLKQWEN